jgi:hypothetical protein
LTLLRDRTQESRILRLLQSNGAGWTTARDLSAIALQYSRAIHCLRKRGVKIENRLELHDGIWHGFFRLAPLPEMPSTARQPARRDQSRPDSQTQPQASLFDDAELAPRYFDHEGQIR